VSTVENPCPQRLFWPLPLPIRCPSPPVLLVGGPRRVAPPREVEGDATTESERRAEDDPFDGGAEIWNADPAAVTARAARLGD